LRPQNYPRIQDSNSRSAGMLDDAKLVKHSRKIPPERLKEIIVSAIRDAGKKSSRAILEIEENLPEEDLTLLLENEGIELFNYFVKYCGDPAASAYDCVGSSYKDVAREQFHNRSAQKERMNSGWRYQFIARDTAIESQRFVSVSDIGAAEADFNAVIKQTDDSEPAISIYVSIKNRQNTMGGQDWPKAIRALEQVAASDKNRSGPYLCVFGIAMVRGQRSIKIEQKTHNPYSVNTEIWLSEFFWPFFSNLSYSEIIREVVSALQSEKPALVKSDFASVPLKLIESFGSICKQFKLLNKEGKFNDAQRLAELFVLGIKAYKAKYGV